jgi:putative transferase (TIGR04331 family)
MNTRLNILKKKKLKILITSQVNQHNKNYKYLTYGCLNFSKNLQKKKIINHPWENRSRFSNDMREIRKISLYILKILKKFLNNYFKINKDSRYWNIILGPWLNSFIFAYYEKDLLIDKILKDKEILIPMFKFNKNTTQIPKDFMTFFTKYIYSDEWQNYLFSSILLNKNKINNIIEKKINLYKSFIDNSNFKTKRNYLNLFKIILLRICNFFLLNRLKKQTLVFFNTYLTFTNILLLALKNFSLPTIISVKKIDFTANIELRNLLIKKNNIKNKFYNRIFNAVLLNIPKDYLENFNEIRNGIFKLNINLKPKTLFTTNGLYHSSVNSIYTAECISNGCKLILAQHGGRYGNLKYFFHTDYELEISDNYLIWGKKKINKKTKSFGIIKKVENYNLNKTQYKNNNQILFLMMSKGRYLRGIDSEMNLKTLYKYYYNDCPKFYSELKNDLKPKLIYRSVGKNYWNEKELLTKKCRLASVDFKFQENNFRYVSSKSRITVCSYLSTTFLELMASNFPVILFTPFSLSSYNRETLNQLELLKKNKIFFDNYICAANFINNNYEKIFEWWNNNEIQHCKKEFLENFSIINPRLLSDIQSLIK